MLFFILFFIVGILVVVRGILDCVLKTLGQNIFNNERWFYTMLFGFLFIAIGMAGAILLQAIQQIPK